MCEHHHHVHEEENNERIILSRIVLAILLFITAMLFTHSTILKCTVLGMAYLIAGYDIIFKALKNIIKGQVFDENKKDDKKPEQQTQQTQTPEAGSKIKTVA